MKYTSPKGTFAIRPPVFNKIESKLNGGIALIAQRVETIESVLVMDANYDGQLLEAGKSAVLLKGEAGLHPWAKDRLKFGEVEYVLIPEGAIVGYKK